MWNNNHQRHKAFSLIEVMVAVSLFAMAILSGMAMLTMNWKIIRKTQERIYVAEIMESRMEELRDMTYDEIVALGATVTFDVSPAVSVEGNPITTILESGDFYRSLSNATGSVYITDLGADLKNVVVEVQWNPAGGSQQSVMSLTSDITRNGVNRQ